MTRSRCGASNENDALSGFGGTPRTVISPRVQSAVKRGGCPRSANVNGPTTWPTTLVGRQIIAPTTAVFAATENAGCALFTSAATPLQWTASSKGNPPTDWEPHE